MVYYPSIQAPQKAPTTPSYLEQDPTNPTAAGAVNNMVRALMSGDANFRNRQAANATSMNPTTTTGGPSVGAPLSLAPPAPGMGSPPPMTPPSAPQMAPPVMPSPAPLPVPRPMDAGAAPVPPSPGLPPDPTAGAPEPGMPGMPNGIDPMMAGLFGQIPAGA
jgi:hypothetical protein